MKIKLTLPEQAVDYVRHARLETLRAVDQSIEPELIEPSPFGMYLLAYGPDEEQPLGMAEFTFYRQVYESFEQSPYPKNIRLKDFGPFESFVGTRTIYVEPEARGQLPPYYLLLAMAGSRICYDFGARFTTATTNASNDYLMRLYEKTGGKLVGTYRDPNVGHFDIAVFVFDLEAIAHHRAMKRLEKHLIVDPQVFSTVQSRSRWTHESLEQCA